MSSRNYLLYSNISPSKLLPILLEESNTKKYKKYVFSVGLAYLVFLVLFFIFNKENFQDSIFNVNEKFIVAAFKILILALVPFLITSFFSITYSAFFLSNKVVFQFLEFLVNAIIVVLLYTIAVNENGVTLIILLSIALIVFYVNTFFTTPIFVKSRNRKKYWKIVLVMSICYFLAMIVFYVGSKNILFIIFNLFLVLFLIYILSFLYGYTRLNLKAQEKLFTLKLGAKNSELQLLKSQVNPHFLFNTLNNLYSFVMTNSPKAGDMILQLSEILDYVLYKSQVSFIEISEEIKCIENYINLEKIRYDERLEVVLEQPKQEISLQIAPLLLLSIVENAFKHSASNSVTATSIKVSIKQDNNNLLFNVRNTKNNNFNGAINDSYKKGIGLKNIKRQLNLLYPEKHILKINDGKDDFNINLQIPT